MVVTQVRARVEANDQITRLGLVSALHVCGKVEVLEASDPAKAHVLLYASDRLRGGAAAKLRKAGMPIVLVADYLDKDDLLTAVECGVVAVLIRSRLTVDTLTAYVLTAASGGAVMPPHLLGNLLKATQRLQRIVDEQLGRNHLGLSDREIDVLQLLSEGHDTTEIAQKLSYSERTIKKIISTVLSRLGLRNRTQAVAHALRADLL